MKISYKSDKLFLISFAFVMILIFAGIIGYFIPEKLYISPYKGFKEDRMIKPYWDNYILVKQETSLSLEIDTKSSSASQDNHIPKSINYEPKAGEIVVKDQNGSPVIFPPHIFGTDDRGLDIAIRTFVGIRVYLIPSIISILISVILGSLIGIASSDLCINIWQRLMFQGIMDVIESLPKYITLLMIIMIIPLDWRNTNIGFIQWNKFHWLAIALGILNSPRIGKLVAEKINSLYKREFIESSISMGLSRFTIALKHVLFYNCLPYFITQITMLITEIIIIEVILCYFGSLGMGWGRDITVDFPYPSWGNILMSGRDYLMTPTGWWIASLPLLVLILSILMINFFGHISTKTLMKERVSVKIKDIAKNPTINQVNQNAGSS
jgi:ABC-type dipeptide/oligopeptide/nickel transport system permease subunit